MEDNIPYIVVVYRYSRSFLVSFKFVVYKDVQFYFDSAKLN